jgi:hypothetical protein
MFGRRSRRFGGGDNVPLSARLQHRWNRMRGIRKTIGFCNCCLDTWYDHILYRLYLLKNCEACAERRRKIRAWVRSWLA